ncbi:hypothetical protein GOP47_0019516 [Adiantum capillus-veneris]|uniref:DUF220 domain-containing protein n=1 Tax=Adiantum capillus-veneris TaxID=13818 RepID=A0A9D4UB77_ADICA|nr:hypothetical protein GOP47_0019516 [Adiantum capillus-veneris]
MACNFDENKTTSLTSCIRHRLQEFQSASNSLAQTLLQQILKNQTESSGKTSVASPHHNITAVGDGHGTLGGERRHEQALQMQMESWKQNPSWVDQTPIMQVSAPKGTLCNIESTFQIGIPPDAVYDIVIDPENKRVFKNIKEVTYRKVLEDDGHRQLVEVEQSAIWRFLCFSGIMHIHLYVDQDRRTHSLKYRLAKEGFMKKFEGTWDVKPVYVDAPHCEVLENPDDEPSCRSSRVASEIHFRQVLQPILVPPPPVSWYIRGITRKQTEFLLEDLQLEAKRLREGNERETHQQQQEEESGEESAQVEHTGTSAHGHPLSSRRRRRNIGWLRK